MRCGPPHGQKDVRQRMPSWRGLRAFAAGVMRIDDAFGQSLVHCDVVQVAEGVLQLLQAATKFFRRRVAFLPGKAPAKNSEA